MVIKHRQKLEDHARWIVGVDLNGNPDPNGTFPIEHAPWAAKHEPEEMSAFAGLVRAQAQNLLSLMSGDDNRTFDSFITGAQQALAPFAFGRLSACMNRSSFSMKDMKESKKPTNLFILTDASRLEAYKPFTGLMQWCCMTAIKRHENKNRPVYFILDEATNYKIKGLENLLTWGRSYGLRLHVIFQDLAAFERVYGKTALDTLLSETEIKQFLPGQRSPKSLELISKKLLGEQSIMSANLAMSEEHPGMRENFSESGRILITEDELRRTNYGIVFVRQNKPILFKPVSYAEIQPWKKSGWHKYILWQAFPQIHQVTFKGGNTMNNYSAKKFRPWAITTFLLRCVIRLIELWPLFLFMALLLSPLQPHLRIRYEYIPIGSHRVMTDCDYWGINGVIKYMHGMQCPFVVVIRTHNQFRESLIERIKL